MEKESKLITYESKFSKGSDGQYHGWKIQRVPGQIKGIRQFRFAKVMKYPNGTEFYNFTSTNVKELRHLQNLLDTMEREGVLIYTNTEEELNP